MNTPHGIVAGFDGSACSQAAVEYAARVARDLDRPLRVVHCHAWSQSQSAVFHAAGQMLADLVATLGPSYPDLTIQPVVVSRSPAATLIAESRTATMVVVGREGTGTYRDCHTGAVARQVANQATCPVVVVPPPTPSPSGGEAVAGGVKAAVAHHGPVFLGLGPHSDPSTTEFAFAEAARRQVALYAALLDDEGHLAGERAVWTDLDWSDGADGSRGDPSLAASHQRHPAVVVRGGRIARASAAQDLLAATGKAGLLVVDASGTGNGKATRLGSLSSALLTQAVCPVAVVERAPD